MKNLFRKTLLALAIITLPCSFALALHLSPSAFPRVYLTGYTGNGLTGDVDILAPLAPVLLHHDQNFFIYAQGRYGYTTEHWYRNPWATSLGLGFRQVVENEDVLGIYLFGDYNRTVNNHSLWVLSPGIESLGRAIDVSLNAYIPVGDHDWKTTGPAEDFGDYDFIRFEGHKKFDHIFTFHQEAGVGGDAEIGRKVFKCHGTLVKAFIDGYFFNMKHNTDVTGVGGRIIISPSNYLEISLNYNYDNYIHSNFLIGAQVSLYNLFHGGSHKVVEDTNLHSRLFDPIERDLATLAIGSAGTSGATLGAGSPISGLPEQIPTPPPEDNGEIIVDPDLWFFNYNITDSNGDGTFEDPFGRNDFTQANMNVIRDYMVDEGDDHASIYFNPGTYPITGSSPATLYNGFELYGRDVDYIQAATNNDRALLVGGLILDSNDLLDSLRMHNDGTNTYALQLTDATNVSLNNTDIGTNASTTSYVRGILMDNSELSMTSSKVYGYSVSSNSSATAYGIEMINGSELTLNGTNMISAYAKGGTRTTVGNVDATAYGIQSSGSTINIAGNDNNINAQAIGGSINATTSAATSIFARTNAYGIYSTSSSALNISGDHNHISAHNTKGFGQLFMIDDGSISAYADSNTYGIYLNSSTATISGSGNDVFAHSVGGNAIAAILNGGPFTALTYARSNASGILATTTSALTISGNNNSLTAQAHGGAINGTAGSAAANAYGILLSGSTAIVSGSSNNLSSRAVGGTQIGVSPATAAGNSYGIRAQSSSTLEFTDSATNSRISVNGSTSQYGIWAIGSTLTNGANYTSLINFLRNIHGGSGGKKILGDGLDIGW